jgi:two-component sensor histidine kinase
LHGGTLAEIDVPCGGRLYSLMSVPIPAQGYVNLYGRDVTERKQAEAALQQANVELETANAELRQEIEQREQVEAALQQSEGRVRRKLESILAPEGDLGHLELADIIDVAAVQKLMDMFYVAAHIPMSILDLKGRVLVGVGWQDICTNFHRVHPDASRHCLDSDTQLSRGLSPGEFRLYKCKNNMWDVATPIVVAGQHVGNVFSGQFFFEGEPVDREAFRAQARGYGFPEEEYLAALDRVPRLSRESLDTGMAFFIQMAELLSQASYGNLKLARSVAERDAALADKDTLLREVHHRVKNNLQMLCDLIYLQMEAMAQPEQHADLQDAYSRIYAIARLHEQLYQSMQGGRIQLAEYLGRLAAGFGNLFPEARVRVDASADGVAVDVDRAIHVGLIVNELITNALKHAFPKGQPGEVSVALRTAGDQVRLQLRDNGRGLPVGFDLERTKTLGLRTVHLLSQRLRATLAVERSGGTVFTLTFPRDADTPVEPSRDAPQ